MFAAPYDLLYEAYEENRILTKKINKVATTVANKNIKKKRAKRM